MIIEEASTFASRSVYSSDCLMDGLFSPAIGKYCATDVTLLTSAGRSVPPALSKTATSQSSRSGGRAVPGARPTL